jgi:transposase
VIHVVRDNYTIHSSRQTRAWLSEKGQRIRLHFLSLYCPDDNRIERRVWREMHANVTTNHRCESMPELMAEVRAWLRRFNHAQSNAAA